MWRALPWNWACNLAGNTFINQIAVAVPNIPRVLGKGRASTIVHNIGPNEALVVIPHNNPIARATFTRWPLGSPMQEKSTPPVRRAAVAEVWLQEVRARRRSVIEAIPLQARYMELPWRLAIERRIVAIAQALTHQDDIKLRQLLITELRRQVLRVVQVHMLQLNPWWQPMPRRM
jgi:hypothetical protein